jgi:hypothetical protein
MLESLPVAAVSASCIAGLFGSIAIRRSSHLGGKLASLRRQLLTQFSCLAVFAATVGIAGRRTLDVAGAASDRPITQAQWLAMEIEVGQRLREAGTWIAALAVIALAAAPSLLHVLREVQSFVLRHRVDLTAREQIALAKPAAHSTP